MTQKKFRVYRLIYQVQRCMQSVELFANPLTYHLMFL
jgi:hypothetical protein